MGENLTGAPMPLVLGDKEFKAYPLRDIDHDVLTNWARQQYLACVEESDPSPRMMRVALQEATSMQWMQFHLMIGTVRGMAQLASVMCREDVPIDVVKAPGRVKEIWSTFEKMNPTNIGTEPKGDTDPN